MEGDMLLTTWTTSFSLSWPHESTSHWAAWWHMSHSSIVCPHYCPQGLLLTRWGNTWSLLRFKWWTLGLRSPLGVRRLLHFVPWFPTDPKSREASVRSVLPWNTGNQTLLSPQSGLKGLQHTGRSPFKLPRLTLGLPERATPGSGLSALYCKCRKRRCSFSSSDTIIYDLSSSHTLCFWALWGVIPRFKA